MPRDGISMEERNDEWGQGCVIDGKCCFDCGDCCDDEDDQNTQEINQHVKEGHTQHCANRIVWGDGICECQMVGIVPGSISKTILAAQVEL